MVFYDLSIFTNNNIIADVDGTARYYWYIRILHKYSIILCIKKTSQYFSNKYIYFDILALSKDGKSILNDIRQSYSMEYME